MSEIWKTIDNTNELYLVSDEGNIKSISAGRVLTPRSNTAGFKQVKVIFSGRARTVKVHKIVAEYFVPNPNNLERLIMLNGKADCRACSLEWKEIKLSKVEQIYEDYNKLRIDNNLVVRKIDETYSIDEYGNVINVITGRVVVQSMHLGSLSVILTIDGYQRRKRVHILVGKLFLKNKEKRVKIVHKDGNLFNNHYSNLTWGTAKEVKKHLLAERYYYEYESMRIKNNLETREIDDRYQIDEYGNIVDVKNKRMVIPVNYFDCVSVELIFNNKKSHHRVHHLMGDLFLENEFRCSMIGHKDGNHLNNHVSNLKWIMVRRTIEESIEVVTKSVSEEENKKRKKDLQLVLRYLKNNDDCKDLIRAIEGCCLHSMTWVNNQQNKKDISTNVSMKVLLLIKTGYFSGNYLYSFVAACTVIEKLAFFKKGNHNRNGLKAIGGCFQGVDEVNYDEVWDKL